MAVNFYYKYTTVDKLEYIERKPSAYPKIYKSLSKNAQI